MRYQAALRPEEARILQMTNVAVKRKQQKLFDSWFAVYERMQPIPPPPPRGPRLFSSIAATHGTHPDNLQYAPISDI